MSEQLFNVLGKLHNFFKRRAWLTGPVHWLLEKWASHTTKEELEWDEEADLAIIEQTPLRAKKLLYWIAGILVVLLLWAGLTEVDEVTRGEGRVTPSRQVQVIQSLDGGIVTELLVREGQ